MNENKYASLFHENMTSIEARSIYFSLVRKDMDETDRQMLNAAYDPIADAICQRELDRARQGWMS